MRFFSHVSWLLVVQAPDVEVDKIEFPRSLPNNSNRKSLTSMESFASNFNTSFWCACPAYFHFISALPEIDLNDLTLAPNQSYLWFGPSFLNQIWESVSAANVIQGMELSNHGNVADGICRTMLYRAGEETTTFYRNGASITRIINNPTFMGPNSSRCLRDFIRKMNFSTAIFMEPHRTCFFRKEKSQRCWIETMASFKPPRRYEVSRFLPMLTSVVPLVVEVVPWTGEKAGVYHSHRHNFTLFVNLAKYGGKCSGDGSRGKKGCCTQALGHQCNPGALSLFAVELMKVVKDLEAVH